MSNKIDQLTPAQESEIISHRDEYLKIGRTTLPCNRKEVEAVFTEFYRILDEEAGVTDPKPPIFEWYRSPKECCEEGAKKVDMTPKQIFECRHSVYWQSWFLHCKVLSKVGVLKMQKDLSDLLELWDRLFLAGHWMFILEDRVLCSERPVALLVDEEGRLHCETGPALLYEDGTGLYSWHGTTVPEEWILDKENMDPQIALTWANVEERRCAAEIMGWLKVLDQLNPVVINKDENPQIGTLLRCDLPDSPKEQFLKVECGTGRTFVLPVPPNMKTAREANAWTYGLEESDFDVQLRT